MLFLALACSHATDTTAPSETDADTDADSDADSDADTDSADSAGIDTAPTGETGATVTSDPRVGLVYALPITAGDWTQPPGLGPLLSSQIGDAQLLVTPTKLSPTDAEFLLATAPAGVQDLCQPTATLSSTAFVDPDVDVAGGAITFASDAVLALGLDDTRLTGRFSATGDALNNAAIGGEMNTTPLSSTLGGASDPGAACDLFAAFGVSCFACASGAGPYCVDVKVEKLTGKQVNQTVVERTTADIDADPSCN